MPGMVLLTNTAHTPLMNMLLHAWLIKILSNQNLAYTAVFLFISHWSGRLLVHPAVAIAEPLQTTHWIWTFTFVFGLAITLTKTVGFISTWD
eukprot:1762890-Karenia_brevis.AAC.1